MKKFLAVIMAAVMILSSMGIRAVPAAAAGTEAGTDAAGKRSEVSVTSPKSGAESAEALAGVADDAESIGEKDSSETGDDPDEADNESGENISETGSSAKKDDAGDSESSEEAENSDLKETSEGKRDNDAAAESAQSEADISAENATGGFEADRIIPEEADEAPIDKPVDLAGAGADADGIVSVALSQLGYTEGSNNYNKYSASFGSPNAAWCGYFIMWCRDQVGISQSVIPNDIKSVPKAHTWYNSRGQYHARGSGYTPKKGDLVIYNWGTTSQPYQHIELVTNVSGSKFTSIGGNTGGGIKVAQHTYSTTHRYITGYCEVNYTIPSPWSFSGTPGGVYGTNLVNTSYAEVKWIQAALNIIQNSGLTIDGYYGNATKNAVISFQQNHGLSVDGTVGSQTISKLVSELNSRGYYDPNASSDVASTYTVNLSNSRTIDDGDYYILAAENQNYEVTVGGESKDDGANVQLYEHNSIVSRQFRFTYVSDGCYKIINNNSGKCLDVEGAGTLAGTNVQQWGYGGGSNQQWYVSPAGDGAYFLVPKHAPSKALDINGGTMANGTNIMIYAQHGGINQKFVMKPVVEPTNTPTPTPTSTPTPVPTSTPVPTAAPSPSGSQFNDVASGQYYAAAVDWAAENNVTTGFTNADGTVSFKPDEGCTRAQFVTFLWRAFGKPAAKNRNNPYKDISNISSQYYGEAVLWASEQGIVTGYTFSDGTAAFGPDDQVTRAQAVTFLWRAAGKPAASSSKSFKDVPDPANYYFGPAVLWGSENGIVTGYTESGGARFAPDDTCTRGQVVTFLYRYAKKYLD